MALRTEEEKERVTTGARKQLAEGTWAEVMTVFGYTNPKAPRTHLEEFARLKAFFEKAGYLNLAKFAEIVAFEEQQNNVSMSYNLSMRPRGGSPIQFMMTPDIMVGTRGGVEGAAVWLQKLEEAIPDAVPESVQIFDKIFGEAIEFLSKPGQKTTLEEMARKVFLEEETSPEPDQSVQ
jgi:hypothetical protein